jgi:DnaA family protein
MKQLPLALPTYSGPSLDNYVPGANLDCLLYLQDAMAQIDTQVPAPTYLWGERGCGKTHLLKSVASAVEQRGGSCGWLTPQQILSEFDPRWAVVLMDDCEQLSERHQAAAFRVFIDAQSFGAWVVAAGAVPPVDLSVREDLRTRLGWGHIFALKRLTDEELQAALWQAFHSRGLVLSQEVQDYLLHHFSRDMTSLMFLMEQMDQYALASKRAVTVPLIKSMLSDNEPVPKNRTGV